MLYRRWGRSTAGLARRGSSIGHVQLQVGVTTEIFASIANPAHDGTVLHLPKGRSQAALWCRPIKTVQRQPSAAGN